ncbi:MAG: DUF1178 family protein [Deltaproteobacteria bacterium]|nr:DUF1178 family protein [Deltaproteobacteria bacterium]
MFIVDLVCGDAHLFEGWYDNREAFDDARRTSSLTCPVCGDANVEQRPSFRGIVSRSPAAPAPMDPSSAEPTTTPPAPAAAVPLEVQRKLSALLKLIKSHTEDAGEQFASRALAMHKGDEEPTPIHGTSTTEEQQTLRDEGVPFGLIPVPDIDQN